MRLCILTFALLVSLAVAARGEGLQSLTLRRPIAVHALPETDHVLVAQRNGAVTRVDVGASRVMFETSVAEQLSSIAPLSGGRFLAADEATHELLLLSVNEQQAEVIARAPAAPYPVSVRATGEGHRATVASLWSRRLTIFCLAASTEKEAVALQAEKVVDLPFAPREQIILPGDQQVMVFDSFGGRCVVVDLDSGKIVLTREFPGHAVRGLALSPDGEMLLASHQMLNPDAHVNQSDIHWGLLMSNDLRWMRLTSLLDPQRELYAGGRVHPLGVPGRGGADPAGVAITPGGTVIVCLGGVNQVMLGTQDDLSLLPVGVGRRPTAVTLLGDGNRAVVVNTFDDSLSVVDLSAKRVVDTISLGPTRPASLLEQGEELFYDARFSHEGWMSCHSCHTDGHSNFVRNDNLSDGGFGAPKLVLSLLGRKDTAPFAWNASVPQLPEQVRNSIHKTMQSDVREIPDDQIAALSAYLESLPSPPSVDALRGHSDAAAIARGRALFGKHDCAKCHAEPNYTVATLEQVGLKDEVGTLGFNPPSLRGVSQRDALLHDGRAKSLEAVFLEQRHPHSQEWSPAEVHDLAAFLRSL
jgi:mono/diheme cytochrome c family protein